MVAAWSDAQRCQQRPGSFSLSSLPSLAVLAFVISLLPHGCKMAATAPNIMSHTTAFKLRKEWSEAEKMILRRSPSTSRFSLTSQWPGLGGTLTPKTISGEGGWAARLGFSSGLGRPTSPEPVAAEQTQGSVSEGRRGGLLGGQPRVSATFSSVL